MNITFYIIILIKHSLYIKFVVIVVTYIIYTIHHLLFKVFIIFLKYNKGDKLKAGLPYNSKTNTNL